MVRFILSLVCLTVLALIGGYGETGGGFVAGAFVGGNKTPDGLEIDCDLPTTEQVKNVGGSDGAGLCVFASIHHAGAWHGERAAYEIFEWMRKHPGGGYPQKVDQMMARICQEKNLPKPDYIQVEGSDIEILAKAVQSGHLVCLTYCNSFTGRYGGQRIAHMVNCVGARIGPQKLWVILDNNFPGTYEWISEEQLKQTYTGMGGGWGIIFLRPGPPPVLRMLDAASGVCVVPK